MHVEGVGCAQAQCLISHALDHIQSGEVGTKKDGGCVGLPRNANL